MSSYLRSGLSVFFLVACFSTPATSNVLTDLFSAPAAPEAATAAPAAVPAPASAACSRQPGPAAAGGHWVYRYDGGRKCWFQAEEAGSVAKKPLRHRLARQSAAAPEDDKSASGRQGDVEDAHAEMRNAAPEQTPQPAPSEPKLTIVRTIPVRVSDAAGQVPPAPDLAKSDPNKPNADQPSSDPSAPRQLDVDSLLAKAPAAGDEVASAIPAMPITALVANTGGGEGWTASWLGALLIALGAVALLIASLRRVLWPGRSLDTMTDRPAFAVGDWDEPSFASEHARFAGVRRDELLRYDPQSVAPLDHASRARQTAPPEPPSKEALWNEELGALAALAQIRFVGPLPSGLRDG